MNNQCKRKPLPAHRTFPSSSQHFSEWHFPLEFSWFSSRMQLRRQKVGGYTSPTFSPGISAVGKFGFYPNSHSSVGSNRRRAIIKKLEPAAIPNVPTYCGDGTEGASDTWQILFKTCMECVSPSPSFPHLQKAKWGRRNVFEELPTGLAQLYDKFSNPTPSRLLKSTKKCSTGRLNVYSD